MGNESPEKLRRVALKCGELQCLVGHTLAAELRVWAEQFERWGDAMEDCELVGQTAGEFVADMGTSAIAYLRSRAEIAAGNEDHVSEQAWLDIANSAENLLSERNAQPTELAATDSTRPISATTFVLV
jgi:hypothetical protein